jgi:CheY-like chemotaxis protein
MNAPGPILPTDTVLYIEDDASNIALVERLLARRPHIRLLLAGSARDGVGTAAAERPALILLDNRLPDATGGDVLRQLASAEGTAGIPVVIMSGDSGWGIVDSLLAGGAAEFLGKPFDIHQFFGVIDRYLPGPPR